MIYLKQKFFGQRLYIEKTDNPQVDEDLIVLFKDAYVDPKPLLISRADVQRIMDWTKNKKSVHN